MMGRFGQFLPESIIKHFLCNRMKEQRAYYFCSFVSCIAFMQTCILSKRSSRQDCKSALFPSISKDLCDTIAPTRCVNSHNILVSSRIY